MRTLRISHSTRYRYDRPVAFGPHHLMLRPRDGHDMRILDSALTVSPQADVHWAYDTFGNSVALLTFHEGSDELVIESELLLKRYGVEEPLLRIESRTGAYPVRYDPEDSIDLAPFIAIDRPEDAPVVNAWIEEVVLPKASGGSLQVLDALGEAVHHAFVYRRREAKGVQSPAATITGGSGTCRDFAFLFMEAARSLGFAARFVTGYLHDPAAEAEGEVVMTGGGATHAWADVFMPGAGWVEFDPTNRIIASRNLIRVATTRTPSQALPVSGTFFPGEGGRCTDMEVRVSVLQAE